MALTPRSADGVLTTREHTPEWIEIPHGYDFLLRPNACPTAEACTIIQSLIQRHEGQFAAIQDQVTQLKAFLAEMEHQQMEQDALAQLAVTLAPIGRLPPEVLSEIFERCLNTRNPSTLFSAPGRHKEAPLLLGRVCRSWRAIAYATPRLWRDVFVNVCDGRYSGALRADALPVLHTWLAHSGSLPLRLVVLCKAERVLPGLVDLFTTIATNAGRWRTVHVRLQNAPVIRGLMANALAQCTALETLEVTDGGQSASRKAQGEAQSGEFDLSLAPLRQISLSLGGFTLRDVRAPWATLTRLSFMQDARTSGTSVTDYAAVLRQCAALKECGIPIGGGVQDAPLEALTLPSLECLSVRVLPAASQTTQMGDFLSVLKAPRLCTLAIGDYCPRQDVVMYHASLKVFLGAHAPTLRHLRFSTASKLFGSKDMIALLVEVPGLTELEYQPDEESSLQALLEALTPRVDKEGDGIMCLLPDLERFFVYWDTRATVATVADMIERRYAMVKRGITRLRHLSCKPVRVSAVYDCMPPGVLMENLAARLAPLCRCGLQVDWEAYRYDLEFSYC